MVLAVVSPSSELSQLFTCQSVLIASMAERAPLDYKHDYCVHADCFLFPQQSE